MPLPPAELGSPPHVRAVDATVILQNGPDGTVDPGPFGGEHSRQRSGVAKSIGVKRGERDRSVTALRGAYRAVAAGRQSSVGSQPVWEFARQERIPLLAAVLLPIGVH